MDGSSPKTAKSMSRRQALAWMAVSPLALALPRAAAAEAPDRTAATPFVLIHGAWHGGWCWKKLTPYLRAAGTDVYAPTLTGLGERSHLISEAVDLSMHIEDVVKVLEYEDLWGAVLVGHSLGGMVVSGVAEAVPERLAHLAYLDAFLPEDGKAVSDYAPIAPTREDGWRVPSIGPIDAFGVTNRQDIEWAGPRLGDQPVRTFTEPVQVSNPRAAALPKTFIRASQTPWFVESGQRARAAGFGYHELLHAGHDAMITRPEELAGLLLGLG